MNRCLVCKNIVKPFINFGEMPIANAFICKKDINTEYKFELKIGFCNECKMVQLFEQPAREKMFHENYSFFSSTSNYMIEHFKNFYRTVKLKQNLNDKSFVLELGCNDGILLNNFKKSNIGCLGIEPSENVADVAIEKGLNIIKEFFDKNLAEKILSKFSKTDTILSANVICHIPYIHSIFGGVKTLLKENGLFIFEDPYLGDVIEKTSFDQFYDEHVFLFSAISVRYIANLYDLELIDVDPQITHGGSMRYTIAHKNSKQISTKVSKLIAKETNNGLDNMQTYTSFETKVNKIKKDLIDLLKELKKNGKKIVAYGATSKSTTVTNYFGIDSSLIESIYDNTPIKQNKVSPGKYIPILPYEQFRNSNPDYVLLFAWNHSREIFEKEREYMGKHRKWITYIPHVKIH